MTAVALCSIDSHSRACVHSFTCSFVPCSHAVRHAEGVHNAVNHAAGNDMPVTFTTPGSERYIDAHLTPRGIQQCKEARTGLSHSARDTTAHRKPQTSVFHACFTLSCLRMLCANAILSHTHILHGAHKHKHAHAFTNRHPAGRHQSASGHRVTVHACTPDRSPHVCGQRHPIHCPRFGERAMGLGQ